MSHWIVLHDSPINPFPNYTSAPSSPVITRSAGARTGFLRRWERPGHDIVRVFVAPGVLQVTGINPQSVSRLRSLCRMNKLGLYFGAEKQEAVLRGDTSNVVVDRYFVYGFQAIGMHLCEAPDASPAMVRLQARHCQRAWETLVDIYRTGDQRLKAQGVLLLVDSLIVMGFTATAPLYLLKLCEIINEANLRFLPVYGRPPELCDQVREDIAVLSQTIYLENYFYLTLGGSVPTMTTRLEREFCQDLQVRIIR